MQKRARNYKAEYQARNERAKASHYRGYAAYRKKSELARDYAIAASLRLVDAGFGDYFDDDNDDLFDTDQFWDLFRGWYDKM